MKARYIYTIGFAVLAALLATYVVQRPFASAPTIKATETTSHPPAIEPADPPPPPPAPPAPK